MGLSLQEQKDLENHKGLWGMVSHMQRIGSEIPMVVLRTLIFLSGGAMVGILTFLGNLWTRNDQVAQQVGKDISEGMYWFGVALAISLVASLIGWVGAYMTSHSVAMVFFKGKPSKLRYFLYPFIFLLVLLTSFAAAAFIWAMYKSFEGLIRHV